MLDLSTRLKIQSSKFRYSGFFSLLVSAMMVGFFSFMVILRGGKDEHFC